MSDDLELFSPESVAMPSPKLAWIKKHGIRRHHNPNMTESPWCVWLPDNDAYPDTTPTDSTCPKGVPNRPDECGYGMTENDALRDLCMRHGMRLWGEDEA